MKFYKKDTIIFLLIYIIINIIIINIIISIFISYIIYQLKYFTIFNIFNSQCINSGLLEIIITLIFQYIFISEIIQLYILLKK